MNGEEITGHDWSMVVPFVVCMSNGGKLSDYDFVAGAQYGQLAQLIRSERPKKQSAYVMTEIVPQVDLLAMAEGYSMIAEPWEHDPEHWTLVTLTKQ